MRYYYSILLIGVLVWGCTSSSTSRARSSRYVITAQEISASTASNGLEVIQQLHPEWLMDQQRRGVKSINVADATEPVVYVNDLRRGGIDNLRRISANNIQEIHYLKSAEATNRFGTGHTGGAFLVKLK